MIISDPVNRQPNPFNFKHRDLHSQALSPIPGGVSPGAKDGQIYTTLRLTEELITSCYTLLHWRILFYKRIRMVFRHVFQALMPTMPGLVSMSKIKCVLYLHILARRVTHNVTFKRTGIALQSRHVRLSRSCKRKTMQPFQF